MAKLIFTDKNYAGHVYELVLERTTVGRGDQNTLVILDSSLSTTHCEILVNGPEVIVRDLDSRNGTFVNGVRLTRQQCQLKSGQTVRFGLVEARLELGTPPSDETTDISAIHALSRITVEQRRERKNPKPAASMKLEPSNSSAIEGHTVIASRPPTSEESAPTPPLERPRHLPQKNFMKTAILIAVALALGLLVLLWARSGR